MFSIAYYEVQKDFLYFLPFSLQDSTDAVPSAFPCASHAPAPALLRIHPPKQFQFLDVFLVLENPKLNASAAGVVSQGSSREE